jgi:hypothetical protein
MRSTNLAVRQVLPPSELDYLPIFGQLIPLFYFLGFIKGLIKKLYSSTKLSSDSM